MATLKIQREELSKTDETYRAAGVDGSPIEGEIVAITDNTHVVSRADFDRLNGDEQLRYLKSKILKDISNVEELKNMPDREKGLLAHGLRGLRSVMKLDSLFFDKKRTVDDMTFMNEKLRDFLNLNGFGLPDYTYRNVIIDDLWEETSSIGATHHQSMVVGNYLNAKFVHPDGREVVFKYNPIGEHILIEDYPDKGTFNYVNGSVGNTFWGRLGISYDHNKFDVRPWEKLMENDPRYRHFRIIPQQYINILTKNTTIWGDIRNTGKTPIIMNLSELRDLREKLPPDQRMEIDAFLASYQNNTDKRILLG